MIEHLNAQIEAIEASIDELIESEPEFVKKRKILRSFVGVGTQSANALLAYLPELGEVSHKKASALVGVAPFADDSANRSGRRMTAGGRAELRQTLYMTVQTALRTNPRIQPLYRRLIKRGRAHQCALIACLNKMIKILTSMLKNETPFLPHESVA